MDPGLGCTGYAVVEEITAGAGKLRLVEAGAIRSRQAEPLPLRLAQIHREIDAVLEEFRPAAMALEDLYTEYRFPRTALQMAHARGAICLAAGARGLPVWNFPARLVKLAVVGHGAASKEQVQSMVSALFALEKPPSPHDVTDAIAIAVTALRRGMTTGLDSPKAN